MRETLRALLGCVGFQVALASNGVEAWELLRRGPRFAAILVDLHTPRMTGNDLVARVRRVARLAEVPIIGMSGQHGPDVPATQAFLQKPFSLEQLVQALASAGVRTEAAHALSRRAAAGEPSPRPSPGGWPPPRGARATAPASAATPGAPAPPPRGRRPRP